MILGQNNSSSDYSFFPLEVGNEWVYETFDFYIDTSDTYLITFKVISDTIMPNGNTYYEFLNYFNIGSSIYFRADKINEKVYIYNDLFPDSEFLVYDFNPNQQSYDFMNSIAHVATGIDQVGNLSFHESYFEFSFSASVDEVIRTSKNIGISMWGQYQWGGTIGKLISAKVNGKNYGDLTDIKTPDEISQNEFELSNYPNPFNSQTIISYKIPDAGNIELSIFNILGEIIEQQIMYHNSSGLYNYSLSMSNESSGVYFAQLKYYGKTKHIKLLNVK